MGLSKEWLLKKKKNASLVPLYYAKCWQIHPPENIRINEILKLFNTLSKEMCLLCIT